MLSLPTGEGVVEGRLRCDRSRSPSPGTLVSACRAASALSFVLVVLAIPLQAQFAARERPGSHQSQAGSGGGLLTGTAVEEIPLPATRTLDREDIERLPSTLHLWTVVGHTEVSVTAERFDVGGMHSDEAMRFGSRGGSWSQNRVLWNGFNVSSSDGGGALLVPDLSTIASLTRVSDSSKIFPPGAVLSLEPQRGESNIHGQAHIFFQSGTLQNVNVTPRLREFGITESDERYRYFAQSNVQLGGPLVSNWTYYGALSRLQIEKWIRNLALPIRSTLTSETVRLSGDISPRDRLDLIWLGQQQRLPREGASPQVAVEATRDTSRPFQSVQASWTHTISPRSSVDTRAAFSTGRTDAAFQAGLDQPGRENLFPGFVDIPLVPSAEAGRGIVALLNLIRTGAPPWALARADRRLQVKAQVHTLRGGPGTSTHRLYLRAELEWLRTRERAHAFGNLNLRFFRGAPDSVQLFSESDVHNHSTQTSAHAADHISLGPLTFSLAGQASWVSGRNRERGGFDSNSLRWGNFGGHAGVGFRIGQGYPLVLRAAVAHSPQESMGRALEAVHPNGLSVSTHFWNDSNLDGSFEPDELGQLTKREGSPFTRIDPGLKRPSSREVHLGAAQTLPGGIVLDLHAFRRVEHALMALINAGVPSSAYDAVEVFDPGNDGASQTGDEAWGPAYNQDAGTLGQDAYLLTNPSGTGAFSEGYEARVSRVGERLQWELAFTRYRSVARTAPGNGSLENDWGRLAVINDPNQSIRAYGSTFFDRGLGARFWGAWQLGGQVRLGWVVSYLDGAPYGRILPVTGLDQGLTSILATRRGPGDGSPGDGKRTAYNLTADLRLSRGFDFRSGHLEATLDVFNLLNLAHALREADVTSPAHLWRIPLRFQTPRSLQLGLRFRW